MVFSAHAIEFGGLPVRTFEPGAPLPDDPTGVAWRVAVDFDEDFTEPLRQLAAMPWAGEVRALLFGFWGGMGDESPPFGAEVVEAVRAFTSVRYFFLGDVVFEECEVSWMNLGDPRDVVQALPQLLTLNLRGGSDGDFSPLDLPELTCLTMESGGLARHNARALLDSRLPRLERLELWTGSSEYGDVPFDDLLPLLRGELFPTVTQLALRNSEHADRIAVEVAGSPLLDRLTSLDLSLGTFGEEGATALLERGLGGLRELRFGHHWVPAPLVEALRAANPDVVIDADDDGGYDVHDDDDHGRRYVAVSE